MEGYLFHVEYYVHFDHKTLQPESQSEVMAFPEHYGNRKSIAAKTLLDIEPDKDYIVIMRLRSHNKCVKWS